MTISRVRPPFEADERAQLVGWLDLQRSIVLWKCQGLAEADAHRSVLPASPLMTAAGVVSHLRWVEHSWFEVILLDRPDRSPRDEGGSEDGDMMVDDDVPLARLLREYERQCEISNEIIAAHPLEETCRNSAYRASVGAASLRWMLFHMVEETARHAGHLDAIRELVDGRTGYY